MLVFRTIQIVTGTRSKFKIEFSCIDICSADSLAGRDGSVGGIWFKSYIMAYAYCLKKRMSYKRAEIECVRQCHEAENESSELENDSIHN